MPLCLAVPDGWSCGPWRRPPPRQTSTVCEVIDVHRDRQHGIDGSGPLYLQVVSLVSRLLLPLWIPRRVCSVRQGSIHPHSMASVLNKREESVHVLLHSFPTFNLNVLQCLTPCPLLTSHHVTAGSHNCCVSGLGDGVSSSPFVGASRFRLIVERYIDYSSLLRGERQHPLLSRVTLVRL